MLRKNIQGIHRLNLVIILIAFLIFVFPACSQMDEVEVVKDEKGMKLMVNDKNFMINGMNWDYFPIGTNYSYSLWSQPDKFIEKALEYEMSLLKEMGVNTIRQYTGVPPKWIQYIYEKYGIYTMLNHSFGRYGVTLGDTWETQTDYSNSVVKKQLLSEVLEMVNEYKGTPGLLLYLLGNENNYGLFWEDAETKDFPVEHEKFAERARAMYRLFNEAAVEMKLQDSFHPVVLCNGDLLFLDIIKDECQDFDIFGTNMYRGMSFGDAFRRVKEELDKPILFTEFGADAYNAVNQEEDQESQARYMVENWKEIYENAYGLGKEQNSLGGFTFQFSDGWWKHGQDKNLMIHDNTASWSNGGYKEDFVKGMNNMNEEWFGICAKGQPNEAGHYELLPRNAFNALKKVHEFDLFKKGTSLERIDTHFEEIHLIYKETE